MALRLNGRVPDDPEVVGEVVARIAELRGGWAYQMPQRARIRAVMDWGVEGIRALLGSNSAKVDEYTPAPALMVSGLNRLAQKIGRPPTLKVPPGHLDRDRAEEAAARRYRILTHLDDGNRLEAMQLPTVGRWLPGYGFAVWVIGERRDPLTGHPYAHASLRDPYDCFPGSFGSDSQPDELAVVRHTTLGKIDKQYPHLRDRLTAAYQSATLAASGRTATPVSVGSGRWEELAGRAVELAEYHCAAGTWLTCPDLGVGVDYLANPLRSSAPFVVARRISFSRTVGQYEHMVGLAAAMAKLNILTAMFIQDNVMSETNVIGEMLSEEYRRGRDAVNLFSPGTRIEKPVNSTNYQVFQMIGSLERQLRIVSGYAPEDDGQPGVSWATGEGFRELRAGIVGEVREYQQVLAEAVQHLDFARLEWEEREYGSQRRPMTGYADGAAFSETYRADRDIAGNYRTRRFYGVMAGFDEPHKIVTGLQLLQGEIIDRETLQENIDGMQNIPVVNERIRKHKAERVMFDRLLQVAATPGDPQAQAANLALVEIMETGDMVTALKRFFTPDEPAMTPEQEAMAGVGGPPGLGPAGPDAISTVLSQLGMGGEAKGGVQTVGTL